MSERGENRHVTAGLAAGPVPGTAPVRPALPRSVGQSEVIGALGADGAAGLSLCAAVSSMPSSSGPRSASNPRSATTGMSANTNQETFRALLFPVRESGSAMIHPSAPVKMSRDPSDDQTRPVESV